VKLYLREWPKHDCADLARVPWTDAVRRKHKCTQRVATVGDVLRLLNADRLFVAPFTTPMGPCVGYRITIADAVQALANGWKVEHHTRAFPGEERVGMPEKYRTLHPDLAQAEVAIPSADLKSSLNRGEGG
jgi:hypothetical protein